MAPEQANPADALRQQLSDWLAPILTELEQAEQQRAWPRIEQLCKQALQRDGENWDLWRRLALSYEARTDWVQAETLWRHLTQRFSSRPEPYLALADLQRRRGAPDAARVVLEQAERRLGASPTVQHSLGVIDDPWALGRGIPQLGVGASAAELGQALQLAQAHLDAGRFPEAEAVLEQILQAKPLAGKVHLRLAQLRRRRGELEPLITQLQPLLADSQRAAALPERLELSLLLAEALISKQRWGEAHGLLELLVPDPQLCQVPALLLASAECAIGFGDELSAQPLLERCLQLQPDLIEAEVLLAELALRLGDWGRAIAGLTRALARQPQRTDLAERLEQARNQELWWRGEQALQQADWPAAAEAFRRLLARDPSQSEALARLDLLASLEPSRLVTIEDKVIAAGPTAALAQRLIEFEACLNRAEAQLKMLGTLA